MKQVKIDITLKTEDQTREYQVIGKYDEKKQILTYYDQFEKVNTILDLKNYTLNRENEQYQLKYQFVLNEKTSNFLTIKELNQTVAIDLKTTKLILSPKRFELSYILINSNEKIEYTITYE